MNKKKISILLFVSLTLCLMVDAQELEGPSCDTILSKVVFDLSYIEKIKEGINKPIADSVSLSLSIRGYKEKSTILLDKAVVAEGYINEEIDEGCVKVCCQKDFEFKIPSHSFKEDEIKIEIILIGKDECLISFLDINIKTKGILLLKEYEIKENKNTSVNNDNLESQEFESYEVEVDYDKPKLTAFYY